MVPHFTAAMQYYHALEGDALKAQVMNLARGDSFYHAIKALKVVVLIHVVI